MPSELRLAPVEPNRARLANSRRSASLCGSRAKSAEKYKSIWNQGKKTFFALPITGRPGISAAREPAGANKAQTESR